MISGLNQEVDILGKTFHFQTELSAESSGAVRTEVFVGGKIVATRETHIGLSEGEAVDEEAVRGRLKEVHNRVLGTFVARARRYQEREREGTLFAPQPSDVDTEEKIVDQSQLAAVVRALKTRPESLYETEPEPSAVILLPPSPGRVSESLRVRRLFGKFRHQVGSFSEEDGRLAERLERAGVGFDWMVRSSNFQEIRVDEQVRCNLLKERIDDWLAGPRETQTAARIWSGIVVFIGYLTEINHRGDLLSFDQQLLVWGIDEVQRARQTDPEVLKHLAALYGRDPELDGMLDEPQDVSAAAWIAHLRRVLTQL